MKKLLLIIAIIGLSFSSFGQDKEIISAFVSSNSLEQIKLASDKIAAAASDKFEYYKTVDRSLRDEKFKVVVYTPATFTAEDKKEFTPEEKEQCLLVVWLVKDDGTFIFKEVSSKPENLKPFWTTTFTTENEYRVNKGLKYKYIKYENSVSIVKSY